MKWLLCLVPFIIGYLMGSFIAASWDIVEWGGAGRYFAGMLSLIGAIGLGIGLYLNPPNK